MTPDTINATFELLGAIFVLNHCRVLFKHKSSDGVSALSLSYFLSWGFWNLYYYPSLNQQLSFYAGVVLATSNVIYLAMVIYFRGKK